ncbi:MAG: right-handed parallel beta-helix repeat-containing protein [Bryobacterales bacterium]|nr:right-handed parallel beta-helix repeat-containing protein [Bryobacterales bacterium]
MPYRYWSYALSFVALSALGLPAAFAANPIQIIETRLDRPTFLTLGVQLLYSNDDNRNATATLRYRQQGEAAWKTALPLFRVRPETVNGLSVPQQFAGSVFDLRPGITYELEIRVQDADGPVDQTITRSATTRSLPGMPRNPRNISVNTTAALVQAFATAQAGDVITIQPGVYPVQFLELRADGTAANPIIVQGANRDTVILEGANCTYCNIIEVYGSHSWIQNLTIRNAQQAIRFQSATTIGGGVRRVLMRNVELGVNGRAGQKDLYFGDNVLEGKLTFPANADNTPGDFGSRYGLAIYGEGTVVAHNQISGFGDGISIKEEGSRAIDIYGNEISYSYDDGIELDTAAGNVRCFRNRVNNTWTGVSAQPTYGGPNYIFRNVMGNLALAQLKAHSLAFTPVRESGGFLVYHNTFYSPYYAMRMWGTPPTHNGVLMNNIYMGPQVLAAADTFDWSGPMDGIRFDYNGYYPDGRFRVALPGQNLLYGNFAQTQAGGVLEQNGRLISALTFANGLIGPATWYNFMPPQNMQLAIGSPAIDGGVVLPNLNDFFTGAAPDLGALETGCPQPVYGPRAAGLNEANQVFGCAAVNPPLNAAPSTISVSPVNRAGTSAIFTARFRDTDGFADLKTVRFAIGPSTAFNGSCVVELDRVLNQVSLYNDAGTARLGPMLPSQAIAIENTQCLVNGLGTTIEWSSETNELIWKVNVAFKTRALKNVYLWAGDLAGTSSGWTLAGTWR